MNTPNVHFYRYKISLVCQFVFCLYWKVRFLHGRFFLVDDFLCCFVTMLNTIDRDSFFIQLATINKQLIYSTTLKATAAELELYYSFSFENIMWFNDNNSPMGRDTFLPRMTSVYSRSIDKDIFPFHLQLHRSEHFGKHLIKLFMWIKIYNAI